MQNKWRISLPFGQSHFPQIFLHPPAWGYEEIMEVLSHVGPWPWSWQFHPINISLHDFVLRAMKRFIHSFMMTYSDYDKYHNTTNISKLIMKYLYCICIPWREIPKTFQYLTGRCWCKLRKEKNDIYIWISIVIMMYDDNTWQGLYDILGGHSLQSVSQGTATELHDMTRENISVRN